jgi:hypothetical protein
MVIDVPLLIAIDHKVSTLDGAGRLGTNLQELGYPVMYEDTA